MRLLPVCLRGLLLLGLMTGWGRGQDPLPVAEARLVTPAAGLDADDWAEIIRSTVLAVMPEQTVKDKRWGHTTSVLSRYEVKSRKGRITVRPKTKEVNHGLWQRQTVTMLKPDETLQIEFQNVNRRPSGELDLTMQVVMRARIKTEYEHWVFGVKGLNGQVEADVTVAVAVDCSLDLTSVQEQGDLLPSIQLVPEVTDLKLKVRDIDARQIGLVGGWVAEEIGDNSRSVVNSILHESEGAILKDLRRKIAKNQHRLRVSPSQLFGGAKPKGGPAKSR